MNVQNLTDETITIINHYALEDLCYHSNAPQESEIDNKIRLTYLIDYSYIERASPSLSKFYNTEMRELTGKIPYETVEWFYNRRVAYLNGEIEEDYNPYSGTFSKLHEN